MNWSEVSIVLQRIGVDTSFLHPSEKNQVQISCPLAERFHKNKTDINPSMGIQFGDKTKWTRYHCFSCGSSGKLWDLVDSVGRLKNDESLIELATHLIEYDRPSISARLQATKSFLNDWIFQKDEEKQVNLNPSILESFEECAYNNVVEYLRDRLVFLSDIEIWGLRYDVRQDRVVFPVYSYNKELRGAVGRSLNNKMSKYYNYFGFDSGKTLGGCDHLNKDRFRLIIVEGFFDLLRCYKWAWEINADVLCTFTANLTKTQADIIMSLDKSVLLCYDIDKAGEKASNKALQLLKKGVVCIRRIRWKNKSLDVGCMTKDQFLTALELKNE